MTTAEKLVLLQDYIATLHDVRKLLSDAIATSPTDEKPGNPTRSAVLANLDLRIAAIQSEINTLINT
jgi:hypothetical protein